MTNLDDSQKRVREFCKQIDLNNDGNGLAKHSHIPVKKRIKTEMPTDPVRHGAHHAQNPEPAENWNKATHFYQV